MSDHQAAMNEQRWLSDTIREWQARVDALTKQRDEALTVGEQLMQGAIRLEAVIADLTKERDKALRDKATLEDVWTRQQQDDAEEINDLMAQVDDLRALLRSVRPVLEAEAVGWSVPEKALLREINAALGESDRPIPN